jgi:hypothetical protein
MKILCRDVVIRGTTAVLVHRWRVETVPRLDGRPHGPSTLYPPQQARRRCVHNPQHYNYSL